MAVATLALQRVAEGHLLKERLYGELKRAILELDVYAAPDELRLDERRLALELGVSRTPVREALARLEHDGLVRNVPRRGTFVVRKTRREIVEIITVWAALESMAARLATREATDAEIASLRVMLAAFCDGAVDARIDEYSEANIAFHQALLRLGHCALLGEMAENLFLHVRAIRKRTIAERGRARRSIVDHLDIVEALEARDAERAERLAREHALGLAAHVERHVDWLD